MMYFTDALLEMGDVSQATDCALLAQTVIPGHYSTRMLRRLAQIAVITADYDVARKYLNILMRTRNHRAWAQDLLESMCVAKNSIVGSDVAPYTIIVGNPARILRKRFDDELIDLLLKLKWWDRSIEEIDSLIPILTCSNLENVRKELRSMV